MKIKKNIQFVIALISITCILSSGCNTNSKPKSTSVLAPPPPAEYYPKHHKLKVQEINSSKYVLYSFSVGSQKDTFWILNNTAIVGDHYHFLLGKDKKIDKNFALNMERNKKNKIKQCDSPNGSTQTDDKPTNSLKLGKSNIDYYIVGCVNDSTSLPILYYIDSTIRATATLNKWDCLAFSTDPNDRYRAVLPITKDQCW